MTMRLRLAVACAIVFLSVLTMIGFCFNGLHYGYSLLLGGVTGVVAGYVLGRLPGSLVGVIYGTLLGVLVVAVYIVCWFMFTLPPYPDVDF
jgi:hypothetical protein